MIAHHIQPLNAAASSRDRGGICASLTGVLFVEIVVRVVSTSSLIGRHDYYLSGVRSHGSVRGWSVMAVPTGTGLEFDSSQLITIGEPPQMSQSRSCS